MKAVVIDRFGTPEAASIQNVSIPEPGKNELLIEVRAAPVNYVDSLVFAGKYQFLPELPFTPGKGPAGVVRAVGEGVAGFSPGDRVLAMAEHGGYAEAAIVNSQNAFQIPDNVSFEDAAEMSLAFDTAWFALFERGRLKSGETVLVLGSTGAVGNAAVQLAKARGARVLAAVSSIKRSAQVLAAAADAVIDLSQPNLRDSLRAQVYEHTGGCGADVIIDPLGGDLFDAAIRAVAWRGRLVVVGFAAGRIPEIRVNYLLLKNIEVSGLQVSDYRKRTPDLMRTCFEEIFQLAADGTIKLGPKELIPLEEFANGLNRLVSRRAQGRVILVPHQ